MKDEKIVIIQAKDYNGDYDYCSPFYFNKRSFPKIRKAVEEICSDFDAKFVESEEEADTHHQNGEYDVMWCLYNGKFTFEELSNETHITISDDDCRWIWIEVKNINGVKDAREKLEI